MEVSNTRIRDLERRLKETFDRCSRVSSLYESAQKRIVDLETEAKNAKRRLSNCQAEAQTQQTRALALETTNQALESEVTRLSNQLLSTRSDLVMQAEDKIHLQKDVDNLKLQLTQLEERWVQRETELSEAFAVLDNSKRFAAEQERAICDERLAALQSSHLERAKILEEQHGNIQRKYAEMVQERDAAVRKVELLEELASVAKASAQSCAEKELELAARLSTLEHTTRAALQRAIEAEAKAQVKSELVEDLKQELATMMRLRLVPPRSRGIPSTLSESV